MQEEGGLHDILLAGLGHRITPLQSHGSHFSGVRSGLTLRKSVRLRVGAGVGVGVGLGAGVGVGAGVVV